VLLPAKNQEQMLRRIGCELQRLPARGVVHLITMTRKLGDELVTARVCSLKQFTMDRLRLIHAGIVA
jgi:hypothetical protein